MKKYLILGFALLMLSARLPAQNRVTGTLSAAAANCATTNVCLQLPITPQVGGVTLTSSANASGNTLQFEATANGGTTWVALNATPSNSTTAATSTTSTGTWQANVAGYTAIRIRMSTLAGGTSTVTISTSTASARSGGGGGGGSIVSCTAPAANGAILFQNGTTNTATCDPNLVWDPMGGALGALQANADGVNSWYAMAPTTTSGVLTGDQQMAGIFAEGSATINSPNTNNDVVGGILGDALGAGSGIFTFLYGSSFNASYSGTGTVSNLYGYNAQPNTNTGGGTINRNVGYGCADHHGLAGSSLNACYYADDQGTGANDYAMYLAGGKAHSAGAIDSNGSISANSDGVHAGELSLLGNTTAPAIAANSFGWIGPNSASFTSWFIQPSSTAPTAGCVPRLGVPSSNVSAMSCDANLNFGSSILTTPNLAFSGSAPAITASGTTPYINASAPLIQTQQCSFNLTTSTLTTAASPVQLCTMTLPNAAVVWRVNCQGGWSVTAGTTPTFAVGNNWAQTPSAVGGDANIGTTNAGAGVEGFTASTSNANILATGTLTTSATIFPVTWWTTFTGSATSGAYHPTASVTGANATGTLVGFCTIQ